MSNIPQLMSGRSLEHDLKFSSKGPMSGLVDGVQSIEATGTVTLSFDESNTQITASVLAIEPDADRSVLLPASLTDAGLDLGGRKLTIFNSSPDLSKDLTIFDSDGTTFVARVGFDSCVTIVFPAHGAPFCIDDLFVGTVAFPASGTDAAAIADAVGAGYTIVPEVLYISNTAAGAANSIKYELLHGTTQIGETAALALAGKNTITLRPNQSEAGTISIGLPANVAMNIDVSGPVGQIVNCRLYYRVIKDDQSALS